MFLPDFVTENMLPNLKFIAYLYYSIKLDAQSEHQSGNLTFQNIFEYRSLTISILHNEKLSICATWFLRIIYSVGYAGFNNRRGKGRQEEYQNLNVQNHVAGISPASRPVGTCQQAFLISLHHTRTLAAKIYTQESLSGQSTCLNTRGGTWM